MARPPLRRPLLLSSRQPFQVVSLLTVLGVANDSQAVEPLGPEPDAAYVAYGAQPRFNPVGGVKVGGSFGSGTLVAPDWVLTAAHVADLFTAGSTFEVGGLSFTIDTALTPRTWDPRLPPANDIALLHLAADAA